LRIRSRLTDAKERFRVSGEKKGVKPGGARIRVLKNHPSFVVRGARGGRVGIGGDMAHRIAASSKAGEN